MLDDRSHSVETTAGRMARSASLRLALTYAVAAALWVLVSDSVVDALMLPPAVERVVNSAKGVLFVAVTAALLFAFSLQRFRTISQSEERYRRLFENATEGIIVFRVDWPAEGCLDAIVEDVNPTQLARLEAAREEVVGLRTREGGRLAEELRPYVDLVCEAAGADRVLRAEVHSEDRDTFTLAVAYPIERDLWVVGATDITEVRRAEELIRRQEDGIRQAYVDVLDAVTGGKLVLVTEQELIEQLGEPLGEPLRFSQGEHLRVVRDYLRQTVASLFPSETLMGNLLSATGEALTNALKHADGGEIALYLKSDAIQVLVRDQGPGIDFRQLPRATLVSGFSTTATLGLGFTIMLQLSRRVLLATRWGSTVVVLEMSTVAAPARSEEAALNK